MSKLLEWREQFALGIPAVDHEHRALIRLINDSWERGTATGSWEERLGELLAQVSAHFALEERLMREAAYDDLIAHKTDHEVLLDRLRDLMDAAEGIPAAELGHELEAWFSVHFGSHDARLHRQLPTH